MYPNWGLGGGQGGQGLPQHSPFIPAPGSTSGQPQQQQQPATFVPSGLPIQQAGFPIIPGLPPGFILQQPSAPPAASWASPPPSALHPHAQLQQHQPYQVGWPSVSPTPVPPPPAPAPASAGVPDSAGVNRVTVHNEAQERELLNKLYDFIRELGGELEPGYSVEIKKRVAGNQAGTLDTYYHSPSGKRFRSKQEIAKSMGLAVPSGGTGPGSRGAKVTGPPVGRLPRDQAASQARETVASLAPQLPLHLECGVTVEDLGRMSPQLQGHHNRITLYPEGYTVTRQAPMGPEPDPATPTQAGTFVSTISHAAGAPVFTVYIVPPGRTRYDKVELASAGDPTTVWMKVWEEQQSALLAVRAAAAAARVQEEQGVQELQQLLQSGGVPEVDTQPEGAGTPGPEGGVGEGAGGGGGATGEKLSVGVIPASTQQAVGAAMVVLPRSQQWLAKVVAMAEAPWGVAEYGFADATLLQVLEGLEGVEACEDYQYASMRGGWEHELKNLAKIADKHSKDAAKAASKAALTLERGVNKVQTFALKHSKRVLAASKKRQPPAALTIVEEQQLQGALLVAAQAAGLMPSDALGASPLKHAQQQQEGEQPGFLASIIAQGRVGGEEVRVRDSIARILDKMITKIEIQERKEKERAELQAGKGTPAAGAHAGSGSPQQGAGAPAGAAEAAPRASHVPPPPPPEPMQQALARGLLAGVLSKAGSPQGGAEGKDSTQDGVPNAARVQDVQQKQELARLVLGLKPEDVDRLLQVWDFVAHMPQLVGLESPPSLLDLLSTVLLPPTPPFSSPPQHQTSATTTNTNATTTANNIASATQGQAGGVPQPPPAEHAAAAGANESAESAESKASVQQLSEQLHVGLVRLLVGEAYDANSTYLMSTTPLPLNKRDTGMGIPRVTPETWPEAARRYIAAVATANYLSMAPGRPPALVTQPLAGALSCLGVHDWLAYLSAGVNTVPSQLQALEEAGRPEVAARGGLGAHSAAIGTTNPRTALPDSKDAAADATARDSKDAAAKDGATAMDVDHEGWASLVAEATRASALGAASAAAAVGGGATDGGLPVTVTAGMVRVAEETGLGTATPGALAGLAADEGIVSGPHLSRGISNSGVHGPGAHVSQVALLPPPTYGSRTAADALLNLEDGRALAAAERLLQQHRLSRMRASHGTEGAPLDTHTPKDSSADPTQQSATDAAAAQQQPQPQQQPEGDGAGPQPMQTEQQGATQAQAHDASEGAQPATGAAAPQPQSTTSGAADAGGAGGQPPVGTKIKFKVKGKAGGGANGGPPMPPAPAGGGAGAAASAAPAAPKFAMHNEDAPYEGLSPQERVLAEQHDVRCGRVLLDTLLRVTSKKGGTGHQMAFCAHELRTLLKASRGVDLHAVSSRLDAGLYQSTGNTARAMAADIVSCCALWRTAAVKMAHHGADRAEKILPFGFEKGGVDLADEVERKLAELLPRFKQLSDEAFQHHLQLHQQQQQQQQQEGAIKAEPGSEQQQQQQQQQQEGVKTEDGTAAGAAAQGDKQGDEQKAVVKKEGGEGGEEGAKGGSSGSSSNSGQMKDLKALWDCRRMYAPAGEGCRVCWRSDDPPHLILCDGCDDEFHCYCAYPPLEDVPECEWRCPLCAVHVGKANPLDKHQQRQEAAALQGGFPLPPLPPPPPAPQLLPSNPQDTKQPQDQQQKDKDQQQQKDKDQGAHTEEEGEGQGQEVPPELRAGMAHIRRLLCLADALGHWAGELQLPPAAAHTLQQQEQPQPQPQPQPQQQPQQQQQQQGQQQQHERGMVVREGGGSVAAPRVQWGPSERLDLLHMLVELAADAGPVRATIEVVEDMRKEAKRLAQGIKNKARTLASSAAEGGAPQPPPPPGTRPARFKMQDRETLTTDESALLTLLEELGEKLSIRRTCLGIDRLGNRYWFITDPGPPAVLPHEKNAVATLAARPTPFSGFVAVEQPLHKPGQDFSKPSSSRASPTPEEHDAREAATHKGANIGPEDDGIGLPMHWGAYTSATSLGPVIAFADGPLRAALMRCKDVMAKAEGQGLTTPSPQPTHLVAATAAGAPINPSDFTTTDTTATTDVHAHDAAAHPSSFSAAAAAERQHADGAGTASGTAGTTPAASAPPSPSPLASPYHPSLGGGTTVSSAAEKAAALAQHGQHSQHTGSVPPQQRQRRSGSRRGASQQLPSLLRFARASPPAPVSVLPQLGAHAAAGAADASAAAGAGGAAGEAATAGAAGALAQHGQHAQQTAAAGGTSVAEGGGGGMEVEQSHASQAALSLQGAHAADAAAVSSAAASAAAGDAVAAAAGAVRAELLVLFDALPQGYLKADNFWGSKERQAAWRDYTARCPPTPCHLSASITLLEHMLADEVLRPHWRWWSHPAQHPGAVTSFTTVWYRLAALHGAFRQHPHGPEHTTKSALGQAAIPPGAPPLSAPRAASAAGGAVQHAPAKGGAHARGVKRGYVLVEEAPEGRAPQRQRTSSVGADWGVGQQDPSEQEQQQQQYAQQQQQQQQQYAQQQQQWEQEQQRRQQQEEEQQQWLEEESEEEGDAGAVDQGEEDEEQRLKRDEDDYNPFADSSAGEPEDEELRNTRRRRSSSAAAVGALSGTEPWERPRRGRGSRGGGGAGGRGSRGGGRGSRGGRAKLAPGKLPTTRAGRLEYAEQRRAERAAAYEAQYGMPAPESALRGRGRGGRRASAPAPPRPPSGRKRRRRSSFDEEDVDAAVSEEEEEVDGYGGGYEYGSAEAEEEEDVDVPMPPSRPSGRQSRGLRVPAPPPPSSTYVPAPPQPAFPPMPPMPPMPPPPPQQSSRRARKPKYDDDEFEGL